MRRSEQERNVANVGCEYDWNVEWDDMKGVMMTTFLIMVFLSWSNSPFSFEFI